MEPDHRQSHDTELVLSDLKTSLFRNYPWPWVNPSAGAKYTLPAKARYDAGNFFSVMTNTNSHDFDGNLTSDIAWRDTSGNIAVWLMGGAVIASSGALGNVPTSWSIVGQRDFNGDGKADLLWRDTSGNTAIWFMNGTQVAVVGGHRQHPHHLVGRRRPATSTATAWATSSGEDSSGNLAVWLMNGAADRVIRRARQRAHHLVAWSAPATSTATARPTSCGATTSATPRSGS